MPWLRYSRKRHPGLNRLGLKLSSLIKEFADHTGKLPSRKQTIRLQNPRGDFPPTRVHRTDHFVHCPAISGKTDFHIPDEFLSPVWEAASIFLMLSSFSSRSRWIRSIISLRLASSISGMASENDSPPRLFSFLH